MLLNSFQRVSKKIEGWYKRAERLTSVLREFQWNSKEVGRMVQRCFKDVSKVFKEFSRKLLFHESLESVTRKIERCFEGVSRVFQGIFKGGSVKFLGCLRVFQGTSKEVKECYKCFIDVS